MTALSLEVLDSRGMLVSEHWGEDRSRELDAAIREAE